MAAGRLRSLRCFYGFGVLGILALCFHHGVEASGENNVIHKKVGETVEFKSNLPTEGVTHAEWKYERDNRVAINEENQQFKGRIDLNPQNYDLIVTNLTLQDSGNYSFVSEMNNDQRPTVLIKLRVHEPITNEPVVLISVSHDASNQSCTVSLTCSTSVSDVSYNWTVGSRTHNGSKMDHVIRPQDGEVTFICTVSNYFHMKSSSVIQKCNNGTFTGQFVLFLAGGGLLLTLVVIVTAVAVYCFKRRQAGNNIYDQTVYAHVSDVAPGHKTMKPCSVYETIDTVDVTTPVTAAVRTVYDQIQLHRVGPDVMSHYQEVS